MNDEQQAKATQEFLASGFYERLLKPYLEERKMSLIEDADALVTQDGSKAQFSINTGRRRELNDLEETFETWAKRDKVKKQA